MLQLTPCAVTLVQGLIVERSQMELETLYLVVQIHQYFKCMRVTDS